MKKISLVLVIFLMITFGLSADNPSAELHMSTNVSPMSEIVIADYESDGVDSLLAFRGLAPSGTEDNPFTFGPDGNGFDGSSTFAVYMMTNVPGTYSVTTTANPLKTTSGSYSMPYSVTVGSGNPQQIGSEGVQLTFLSGIVVGSGDGLSFEQSAEVTLTVTEADYLAAGAGSYTSVWTVELIKN